MIADKCMNRSLLEEVDICYLFTIIKQNQILFQPVLMNAVFAHTNGKRQLLMLGKVNTI